MSATRKPSPGRAPTAGWRGLLGRLRRIARDTGPPRRWVVCDLETSGLDPGEDALLAIGAVALHDGRIVPADSFEARLRPSRLADRRNILVHQIGEQAQREAQPARQALSSFADFVGEDPLVGFHAGFDRAFLRRACRAAGLAMPPGPWLDLAELAPVLLDGPPERSLDAWLEAHRIPVSQRHDASGDAMATAMLFQVLLSRVAPAQRSHAVLARRSREARWLSRSA